MPKHLAAAVSLAILAATALPAMAATAPDSRTAFIKSCVTQMYYSQAVCTCMADKAATAIGLEGIAYLSLQALDVVHSAAMSKSMSASERNKIDSFMKTAPHQCGSK
jgi:hypothetical protein